MALQIYKPSENVDDCLCGQKENVSKLCETGDRLIEIVEVLHDDPVIMTYLREYSDNTENALEELLFKWDCLIGEMQKAGIYQAELMQFPESDVIYE